MVASTVANDVLFSSTRTAESVAEPAGCTVQHERGVLHDMNEIVRQVCHSFQNGSDAGHNRGITAQQTRTA